MDRSETSLRLPSTCADIKLAGDPTENTLTPIELLHSKFELSLVY